MSTGILIYIKVKKKKVTTSLQEIERIGKLVKYHHGHAINIIQTNDWLLQQISDDGEVGRNDCPSETIGPTPGHTRCRDRERPEASHHPLGA